MEVNSLPWEEVTKDLFHGIQGAQSKQTKALFSFVLHPLGLL